MLAGAGPAPALNAQPAIDAAPSAFNGTPDFSAQPAFSAHTSNQTAGHFQGSAPSNPRIPNLLAGFNEAPPPEDSRPFPDGGDRLAPVTPVQETPAFEAVPVHPAFTPDRPSLEISPTPAQTPYESEVPVPEAAPAIPDTTPDLQSAKPVIAPQSDPETQFMPDSNAHANIPQEPDMPFSEPVPGEDAPLDMPTFQAATADPTLTVDEVRDKIIEGLKFTKSFLASTLMGTMPWETDGDRLIIPVDSDFKKSSLMAEVHEINAQIKSVWGRALKIMVEYREPEKAPEVIQPDAVKNVLKVFNGTVVQVTDVKETDTDNSEQNTAYQPEGEQTDEFQSI